MFVDWRDFIRPGIITAKVTFGLKPVRVAAVLQTEIKQIHNVGDVTILGVGEGKETISTIASPTSARWSGSR